MNSGLSTITPGMMGKELSQIVTWRRERKGLILLVVVFVHHMGGIESDGAAMAGK